MVSNSLPAFVRAQARELERRLREPRRFIQVVAGPRQVGKSTLVQQVLGRSSVRAHYVSADEPSLRSTAWIEQHWQLARERAATRGATPVLALDEIQKLPGWSETVKRLWDEDARSGCPLRVVLLGSAPLLVQRGLGESLAGRFELIHLGHWSFVEMGEAFGFTLDDYLCFGGYPGAAPLVREPERWRRYVLDSLVETSISRDVLLLSRVDKPALLRQLFELSCAYSGQVLSYTKLLGQLQDAGNVTTLAHYLELLDAAGMVVGLQKYAGAVVRRRGSMPKLLVRNTALMTAQAGGDPRETFRAPERRGRLVESAVGAHLANAASAGRFALYYWRERGDEVDFVVERAGKLTALEVKSGSAQSTSFGMDAFVRAFGPAKTLLVGGDGIPLEEFLSRPCEAWLA